MSKKNKKKKSVKKKIFISLSIFILLLIGIASGALAYSYTLLNSIDKVSLDEDDLGINGTSSLKGITNIALYGIDTDYNDSGRSDSIMILTIDNINKELKVSSIMRDSYVSIDGHGMDKINHAYAYGGPQLSIKTLNQNFDLDIEDFVTLNFNSFPQIIDGLGGIDLTITQEEIDCYININDHITYLNELNGTNSQLITTPGTYHADGTQALAYARIRYTSEGDTGRTKRQRVVLEQLLEKFKSISPTKYTSLLNEFLPLIKTSLTSNEILSIATTIFKMGDVELQQAKFPSDNYLQDTMINGTYYLKFNEDATTKEIHDFIYN